MNLLTSKPNSELNVGLQMKEKFRSKQPRLKWGKPWITQTPNSGTIQINKGSILLPFPWWPSRSLQNFNRFASSSCHLTRVDLPYRWFTSYLIISTWSQIFDIRLDYFKMVTYNESTIDMVNQMRSHCRPE